MPINQLLAGFPGDPSPIYINTINTAINPHLVQASSADAVSLANSLAALADSATLRKKSSSVGEIIPQLDKISSVFNVQNVKEDVVGLELENEFRAPFPSLWNEDTQFSLQSDSSLRHYGYEWVSRPLKREEYKTHLGNCLKDINAAYKKVKPTNSIRTSTHVHLNFSNKSLLDVYKFALVYWTLEDFLLPFCGDFRKGNLHCISIKNNGFVPSIFKGMFTEVEKSLVKRQAILSPDYRYGSLNWSSLAKFGTLESRLMRGTLSLEEIEIWTDTLLKIKDFAESMKNPKEFHNYFMNSINANDFPEIVLGDLATVYKGLQNELVCDTIRESFFRVEDFIYLVDDWDFSAQKEKLEKMKETRASKKYSWTKDEICNPFTPDTDQVQLDSIPVTAVEIEEDI